MNYQKFDITSLFGEIYNDILKNKTSFTHLPTEINDLTFIIAPETTSINRESTTEHQYLYQPMEDTNKLVLKSYSSSPGKQQSQNKSSSQYIEIMRAHFMNPILDTLHKIQPHTKTSAATMYIHTILHSIQTLDEKSPNDPVLEVLFALYDALAHNDLWVTYEAKQFAIAEKILAKLVAQVPLKAIDIEKAKLSLDEVGFDTMPFNFSIEGDDI